jgi:HlyD family secretion protein
MKSMLKGLIALLILAVLGGGGYLGFQTWYSHKPTVSYKTAPVRRTTLVSTVTATGNLEPILKVLVGSQVSGTVTKWYADFNQKVEQDFVLAELDQDRFRATHDQRQAALSAARARVEVARAALADAKLKKEHAESNRAQHAATELEFQEARIAEEQALASLHAAEAEVEQADAETRLAQVDLDRTIIRSPISGIVISRDVDAGQTVAASLSAPTLFTIANDLAKLRVNAAVSETDIGKVTEGSTADFRVDAYPDRRFHGIVSQVRYAETIVDNVVTYTTMIEVDNSDLALRPGMTATISFEVARAADVLTVPNAAMRFSPDAKVDLEPGRPGRARKVQPRVFRLENGNLMEIAIEPGLTDGTLTEVRSGDVKEGDLVVTEQIGGNRPSTGMAPRGPRM